MMSCADVRAIIPAAFTKVSRRAMLHSMNRWAHPSNGKIKGCHALIAWTGHNNPASRVALAIYSGTGRRMQD